MIFFFVLFFLFLIETKYLLVNNGTKIRNIVFFGSYSSATSLCCCFMFIVYFLKKNANNLGAFFFHPLFLILLCAHSTICDFSCIWRHLYGLIDGEILIWLVIFFMSSSYLFISDNEWLLFLLKLLLSRRAVPKMRKLMDSLRKELLIWILEEEFPDRLVWRGNDLHWKQSIFVASIYRALFYIY